MRYLVTGGAGFVGSNLVETLAESGKVRVFDNLSTGRRENLEEFRSQVELWEDDLRDREAVRRACQDVEVVFHQGALPSVPRSVEDPLASFEVNAGGTLNILMAARDAGVRRVVYAASSSAYGDSPELPKHEGLPTSPRSPYAADKVHGENLCRVFQATYGLECVVLRYFNVFGPRQLPDSAYAAVIPSFVNAVLDGKSPVIYGDGRQSRDFTFVGNVVRANQLAASVPQASGHTLNVGSGRRTDLLQLLDMICRACGRQVPPVFEAARAGDVRDSLADLARVREVLGYEASVDLPAGLQITVEWMRRCRSA